MRLILKEYVSSLKEKDELDYLLCEIYAEKGYVADTVPKSGNRQYGVDIQMHNNDELIFFVVKQGSIDRRIWDSDINSIRPSLNEVKDVAIRLLTPADKQKRLTIIVATNGVMEESVKPNWSGYVSSNQNWDGISVNIQFLGIDGIVKDIQSVLFNEYIFNTSMRSSLRKALYFIDADVDYNPQYYEKILDNIILDNMQKATNKTKQKKAWAIYYMISQMIAQYAHDAELNKVAIMVTEYAIVRYWKYLFEFDKFEKDADVERLIKLIKRYLYWNRFYLLEAEQIANDEADLPYYNMVEVKVILYEILGFLASYASVSWTYDNKNTAQIIEVIIRLLNKYEYYKLPPYDVNISTIIMILDLLNKTDQKDNLKSLMENILYSCIDSYRYLNLYPAPSDTFEEALRISRREKELEYQTSSFWGYFMMLIYKYKNKELYEVAKEFANIDLKNICKCVWFLRKDEESVFYEKAAMNNGGEGIEINACEEYKDFCETLEFIIDHYKNEVFSFDIYGFSSLENIICRYYGYIPRIVINQADSGEQN